ncbi:MAG: hypothetical protein HY259_00145 [Chloroflexi bacterium]|nr:hypothetical protein [Chloroflexota bacterium]
MSEQTLNPPQSQPQSLPPTVIGGLPLRGEFVLRLYPGPIVLVATALLVAAMLWGYFATERPAAGYTAGARAKHPNLARPAGGS